jgi:hypothetical protein
MEFIYYSGYLFNNVLHRAPQCTLVVFGAQTIGFLCSLTFALSLESSAAKTSDQDASPDGFILNSSDVQDFEIWS